MPYLHGRTSSGTDCQLECQRIVLACLPPRVHKRCVFILWFTYVFTVQVVILTVTRFTVMVFVRRMASPSR